MKNLGLGASKSMEFDIKSNAEDVAAKDLYYSYQLLSIVSTLYAKGYEYEYKENRKEKWTANIDSILLDVENLSEIWQMVNEEINYGIPFVLNYTNYEKIRKYYTRINLISKCLHQWVVLGRFPKFMISSEMYLMEICGFLRDSYEFDHDQLTLISENIRTRIDHLKEIKKSYDVEIGRAHV